MLLFDTGKKLERAFTREQFDALVEVLDSRQDRTATKEDLRELELRTKVEIEKVRAETERTKAQLQADIAQLRLDVARDLRKMEMRMVIKLGGMLVVGIGLIATLQRLL